MNVLGITMGDPGGVGSEVIVKALAVLEGKDEARFILFGDKKQIERRAHELGLWNQIDWRKVDFHLTETEGTDFEIGRLTDEGSQAQVDYIAAALDAIDKKEIEAIVTAPIHKQALANRGLPYKGHTEWLEAHAGKRAVMMLAGPKLRVVPTTVHIPLKDVAAHLTPELLRETLTITYEATAELFGIEKPRIAVCGLNPHAGDGGLLGSEEKELISPIVAEFQDEGWPLFGPFPGDTAFYFAFRGHYDAVIAMYHDQALAPLKLVHFDEAVNITLGLPFLRTSVDHGTAYDIAGQGIANAESMKQALLIALNAQPHSR